MKKINTPKDPKNRKEWSRQYRQKNREKIREQKKEYYRKNINKIRERNLKYKTTHKEEIKEQKKEDYWKNRDKHLRQRKEWYIAHRERILSHYKECRKNDGGRTRANANRWSRRKRKEDPQFRLNDSMGSAMRFTLKGRKAGLKWEALVGYTKDDLIKHLEKQFDDKMNWNNYGTYWHIDHIKPSSLFNFTRPEDKEFKDCWALSNLQPLERIANLSKGKKYEER